MFTSPQLSTKRLTELCYRVGTSLEAGIDVRRVWQHEAETAPYYARRSIAGVCRGVESGQPLAAELARCGRLFPKLLTEMVDVGEKTGTLAEVFRRLSDHYHHVREVRRTFFVAIAWPMFQLFAALFMIGLLIYVMGIVAARGGQPIDVLGLGLVGSRGLWIYTGILVALAAAVALLVTAVRRGMLWTRPLQRMAMRIPVVGRCLEKLALARISWAMYLTLNVEMDLRRLIPLVLRASGNGYYISQSRSIVSSVEEGLPLHAAFNNTAAFPARFIEALHVAEESGRTVEAMERLSGQYQEEAESSVRTLAVIAGLGVWALVAAFIILMIFRLFGFYMNAINDAVGM